MNLYAENKRNDNDLPERFAASSDVTVIVENPKTPNAEITEVIQGDFVKGASMGRIFDMFEMTAAGEHGNLLVGRVGNRNLEWEDVNGRQNSGIYDIVYSYYNPSNDADVCNVNKFTKPRPISYAHEDPAARALFGFAKYPIRDAANQEIDAGREIGSTYPWVDSKGDNIFFTYNGDRLENQNFEIDCPSNTNCSNPNNFEEYGPAHSNIAGFGLRTRGKIRSFDNMLANTDWGLRTGGGEHRLVKLYSDDIGDSPITQGWVRVGNGRHNVGDSSPQLPDFTAGNMAHIDSIENKAFSVLAMRLDMPRDVTWLMSNGKATDVISFDESLGIYNLVSSEMIHATRLVRDGARYRFRIFEESGEQNCVQNNAATSLYNLPECGEILGRGRLEKVALGGFRGRGFFSWADGGLKYDIPNNNNSSEYSETDWLVLVMLAPKFEARNAYRTLFEFPDGSQLDIRGLNTISFKDVDGNRADYEMRTALVTDKFHNIALRTYQQGFDLYVDGMLELEVSNSQLADEGMASLFKLPSGAPFVVGRGLQDEQGVRGWLDDFSITGEASNLNTEEICNKFMGSIVEVDTNRAARDIAARANNTSDLFQQKVRSELGTPNSNKRYLCYNGEANEDGWMDLKILTTGLTSMRAQLLFDSIHSQSDALLSAFEPRPDHSENEFCLSCHATDGASLTNGQPTVPGSLAIEALTSNPNLLLRDDPRLQPSYPKDRKVCGEIPEYLAGLTADGDGCVNALDLIHQ